jgi:predicted alpha/beta hydrolase family esterase
MHNLPADSPSREVLDRCPIRSVTSHLLAAVGSPPPTDRLRTGAPHAGTLDLRVMTDQQPATDLPAGDAFRAPQIERVVVVHAMNSTLDDHWYRALTRRLWDRCTVVIPAMPTPYEPDAGAWQATLEEAVGPVDESTLVIGHSVGNAAALRYLTSLDPGWTLGGLVNVAGFSDPQPGNDATIPFVQDIDHDLIRTSTLLRDAFISSDDPEVPADLTTALATRLTSTVHTIDHAGHFRGEDGYRNFPQLERLVLGRVCASDG